MQSTIMVFSVWFRALRLTAMPLNLARVKKNCGESYCLLFFSLAVQNI